MTLTDVIMYDVDRRHNVVSKVPVTPSRHAENASHSHKHAPWLSAYTDIRCRTVQSKCLIHSYKTICIGLLSKFTVVTMANINEIFLRYERDFIPTNFRKLFENRKIRIIVATKILKKIRKI